MSLKSLTGGAVAALVSSSAFAHETAVAHVHPHGADLLVMALALAVLAIGGIKAGLFSRVKSNDKR